MLGGGEHGCAGYRGGLRFRTRNALAGEENRPLRARLAETATSPRDPFVMPAIAIRTGATPPSERARFLRDPADILITTPESIYLMLTSNARETLRGVDTVIVDEIHALVPNKRGAHLALSLERLARITDKPPQRIGLSATQRPLEEVARFLGGSAAVPAAGPAASRRRSESPEEAIESQFGAPSKPNYRPVPIIDTEAKKKLTLKVEVPVEEMAKLTEPA